MVSQNRLSEIFRLAEKSRLDGEPPVENWGSNRLGDKDSLWNTETDTHFERDHPSGEWQIVPTIGESNA